jgi:hypothetical protein
MLGKNNCVRVAILLRSNFIAWHMENRGKIFQPEVEINVVFSLIFIFKQNIVCGIPQGFILRPLLFILYINDISNACFYIDRVLNFADDTSIFYSHSDPNYLESVMNEELQMFDVWMKCNKVSINIKKCYFQIE